MKEIPTRITMKTDISKIIARYLLPLEYLRTKRFVRDNIAHAIKCPSSRTADLVAEHSRHLASQFGR